MCHPKGLQANAEDNFLLRIPLQCKLPQEKLLGQWEQDFKQAHQRLHLHYSWRFDCRMPNKFKVAGERGMVLTAARRHQDFAYLVALSNAPLLSGPEINSSSNICTYL